ncbi:MAG: enoyl-CoA hydratase-related protein [bacterium]|nr:enoyl-CoA hydratase-related protein [bacterium]MDE0602475.1 enoyl-CoA hydratase-related protein [bacterium]
MVRYEAGEGRATLTIDQPHRRNPLSVKTLEGLISGTRRALEDPEVRVLVYTGSGDQAFCAGADLDGGMFDDPVGLHRQRGALADLFRLMIRGGKPTIARVNGHALGGGFGLMCACDVVICVEEAKLGTPEVRVGVWPMVISAVLVRTIPRRALLEMMMTGRLLSPAEALGLGAVSRVVERDRLDHAVSETVRSLTARSPAALQLGKDTFWMVNDLGIDAALDFLAGGLTATLMSEDAPEGISAFLEKRPAAWSGR